MIEMIDKVEFKTRIFFLPTNLQHYGYCQNSIIHFSLTAKAPDILVEYLTFCCINIILQKVKYFLEDEKKILVLFLR